jgi:hypothetical protein
MTRSHVICPVLLICLCSFLSSAQERERVTLNQQLEERRVVAEEKKANTEAEALKKQTVRDWVTGIASAVPLVLLLFGVYQLRRTLQGQAQLKVLDFADSGHDDEDMLRRAKLASEVLSHELPRGFKALINSRKPARRHLPFPVVEHRSELIKMLVGGTPEKRIEIIRYWNACFNDFKSDTPNHWFARIALEAGVDLKTLPDFNK